MEDKGNPGDCMNSGVSMVVGRKSSAIFALTMASLPHQLHWAPGSSMRSYKLHLVKYCKTSVCWQIFLYKSLFQIVTMNILLTSQHLKHASVNGNNNKARSQKEILKATNENTSTLIFICLIALKNMSNLQ